MRSSSHLLRHHLWHLFKLQAPGSHLRSECLRGGPSICFSKQVSSSTQRMKMLTKAREHGFKIDQPTDRPLGVPGTEPRAAPWEMQAGEGCAPSQWIDSPARGRGAGNRMAEIRGENEVWIPGRGEDHALKKSKGET